jgi:hypothetical protein
MTTKTQAELIAEALGEDGRNFETAYGRSLVDLVNEAGGRTEYARFVMDEADEGWGDCGHYVEISRGDADSNTTVRYVLPDGSALVAAGDCWDVEGPTPFVMSGAL